MWRNVLKIVAPDDDDDDDNNNNNIINSDRGGWDNDDIDIDIDIDDNGDNGVVDVDEYNVNNDGNDNYGDGWDDDDDDAEVDATLLDTDDADNEALFVMSSSESRINTGTQNHDTMWATYETATDAPPPPTTTTATTTTAATTTSTTPPPTVSSWSSNHALAAPTTDVPAPDATATTTTTTDDTAATSAVGVNVVTPCNSNKMITSLQKQHEDDLQKQYIIIDQKSHIIRELQKQFDTVQTSMQQQQQDQCASIASELVSTTKERDLLQASLQHHIQTIQQLQYQIDTVVNPQYVQLQTDNTNYQLTIGTLQETIQQLSQESRSYTNQQMKLEEEYNHRMEGRISDIQSQYETQYNTLQEKYQQLENELSVVIEEKKSNDAFGNNNNHTEQQQQQAVITTLQNDNDSLRQQITRYETELQSVMQQLNNSSNDTTTIESLQGEIQRYETEQHNYEALTQVQGNTINDLQNECMTLRSCQQQLQILQDQQQQLDTIRLDDIDNNDDLIESNNSNTDGNSDTEWQLECTALRERIHDLEQEKDGYIAQIQQQDSVIDDLQIECNDLRTNSLQKEQDDGDEKVQLELLQMQCESLQQEVLQLHTINEEQSDELLKTEKSQSTIEETEQLREEISRLQQDQKNNDETINQLRLDCDAFRDDIEQYEKQEERVQEETTALREENEKLRNDLSQYEHDNKTDIERVKEFQIRCESLQQEVSRLSNVNEEQNYEYSTENNQLITDSEGLRQEISHLQQDQKNNIDTIQQLQFECEALREDIEQFEKQEDRVQEEAATLRTEIERLSNERCVLTQQLEQLQDETTKLYDTIANLQQNHPSSEQLEIDIIRSRFDIAIQERDTYSAENEELYVQLGYMKQKLDATDELSLQLQMEVKTLQTQLDHVDLEQLSSSERSLLVRNTSLDQQIQTLTDGKSELITQNQELQKQVEDYKTNQNVERTFAELRETIAYLNEQLTVKDQFIGMKNKEIQELQERLEINRGDPSVGSVADHGANDTEVERYQEKIHDLEMKCESLSMQLESVRSQLDTTEGALIAREQLSSMRSAISEFETNDNNVSRLVQESEIHIRGLENELQNKSKYVNELQDSVCNLKFLLEEVDVAKEKEIEITKRDDEINALKEELESINVKLSITEEQLHRIVGTAEGIAATTHMKEIDYLRSNIVAVALALEQSEMNRADALGRLVSEREAYAVHLRSMSDKLKRFYSTVTFRGV